MLPPKTYLKINFFLFFFINFQIPKPADPSLPRFVSTSADRKEAEYFTIQVFQDNQANFVVTILGILG
jgi:hypothetical protein